MKREVLVERVSCPEHIDGDEILKVKNCGNVIEAVYMPRSENVCRIRKLSKDDYVLLSTGEVKNFDRSQNRSELIDSVRQSLNRLRDYINTNVTDCEKCRWITLTYRENMTDSKRLYTDIKKFIMRIRYLIGGFEYIIAIEPQARGAWHAHMIAIFEDSAPFIPNDMLERLWGHGFTKMKAVNDVDNLGLYFTAYLADMELTMDADGLEVLENTENARIEDKTVINTVISDDVTSDKPANRTSKQIVKGGRLYMYPSGINIYRISKGIKPPVICQITETALQEEIKDLELLHERAVRISIPSIYPTGKPKEFMIYKRFYNRLRKKEDVEGMTLFRRS